MIGFVLNLLVILLLLFLLFLIVKLGARMFGVPLSQEAIQILGLIFLIILILYILGYAGTFGSPWRFPPLRG